MHAAAPSIQGWSFPGHSPILSHSCGKTLEFSPQLQDKIWESPGNKATFSFVSAKKVIWWVISRESCLETNHLIFWWVPNVNSERVYGHHLSLHYWGRWRTQSRHSHQLTATALARFTYPQRIWSMNQLGTQIATFLAFQKCKHHCCWCVTHGNKEIHLLVTVATVWIATFILCLEVTTMNKYHYSYIES